uniref:RNA-directed DNA polymerase from transposon X-element n=1 Tax=Hirondellea gigas TaxID=1518452 RepID=A0A2P2I4G8_9CRUS
MNYLETSAVLPPLQYDFRKMRSAVDALVRFTSDISAAFVNKEHLVCVFFDMMKAYDTTWRRGILNVVHDIGIRGSMAFFIVNFLQDRNFRTRVGQEFSNAHHQEEGVPQRNVLSCSLFSLAINNIITDLPRNILSSLCVDDLMIYLTSANLPSLERRLQLAINKVSSWATTHGFTLSTNKTAAVHFNRKRGYAEPSLFLNNIMITMSPTAKFLGMILGQKLNWKEHIKRLKNNCMKRLNVLRCISV